MALGVVRADVLARLRGPVLAAARRPFFPGHCATSFLWMVLAPNNELLEANLSRVVRLSMGLTFRVRVYGPHCTLSYVAYPLNSAPGAYIRKDRPREDGGEQDGPSFRYPQVYRGMRDLHLLHL